MKRLAIFIALALLGWQAFQEHRSARGHDADDTSAGYFLERPASASVKSEPGRFACDGRQYCSQMTSCEEATFFIQHCPDTKMDGNHDGVPCEKQWCR